MNDFTKPVGQAQAWGKVGLLLALLEGYEMDDPRFGYSVELCKQLSAEIAKQIGAQTD
ncbi:MAG: hypothetical protein AAF429_03615 [Pseudomonadota bacterium]